MGGPSPGSAPTGMGSVRPVEVPGAGVGTGALTITGTGSGVSVSGPMAGTGPEANPRAEKDRSPTPGPASTLSPVTAASPACRRQPPGSASSEISAVGRYTSAVV